MKATDITHKDNAGLEWAVMSPNGWATKEQKSKGNVDRKQCSKVALVDTAKYASTHHVQPINSSAFFVLAPKGERASGFLVTNGSDFWVISSNEFIAPWKQMEPKWIAKEAIQAEEEAQKARRKDAEENLTATLIADKQALTASIRKATGGILGLHAQARIYLAVGITWQEDTPTGSITGDVTLSVGDYQRLLEKLFEAREANN
jgi:hypothetical protein